MEQLGIEPNLLLAQIVNFLIILLVLSKLLYKPILHMLEKRKKEIAEGLALTEKMKGEEEKMKAKEEKLLGEARREARNIVEAGEKEAEEVKKEILAKARAEAAVIVEKGKEDVAGLRQEMEKDISRTAISIAEAMTKRLVSGVLNVSDQHKLLAKQLKDLERTKAS
jgi:F-type H+-transporting ATPase subunit b